MSCKKCSLYEALLFEWHSASHVEALQFRDFYLYPLSICGHLKRLYGLYKKTIYLDFFFSSPASCSTPGCWSFRKIMHS